MKTRVVFLALLVTAMLPAGFSRAAETKPTENLAELVKTALANNPEVTASGAHLRMLENKAKQAGSLEDPMLMLKIQNGVVSDPLNFRRDSMTQKVVGISQQLPWFGKRGLKSEVARRDAEASHWNREERILDIVRGVKETYYQIYFTDKSLEILAKNTRILDDFITIAQNRYAVGQGVQQDIFKAQLEKSKLLDMKITLEQQRRGLEIRLNSLLYRSVNTPVGTIPDPQILPLNHGDAELLEQAEKNRPLLKGMQAQIGKTQAAQALARKEFFPDFTVSFEYMQREPAMGSDGSDMYGLGVTFNLPVQRERRHAMLAESASEQAMSTAELNDAKNSIRSAIADLISQMERRRKLAELYKGGIIPQAEQALESAVIAYRVGKVDFLALLDSRLTLFNYERDYYDSLADYQIRLAQLEATVGADLENGNTLADHYQH
ncbi:TolC family protein [Oryzomonas sagensis]|uniref:TolC family protein n=1 Tax=Oryzomonas sagensis TaxID=2603857 RepID=A0ABQ6TQ94_9BACT|nr:TolC family protein [Oryzomonas sagensis]KAB0671140.1 TolC family protein [Oryzomonas sagensis]